MNFSNQIYHMALEIQEDEKTEESLRKEQMETYKCEIRIRSIEKTLENLSIMDPQYDLFEEQLVSMVDKHRYHLERCARIDHELRKQRDMFKPE